MILGKIYGLRLLWLFIYFFIYRGIFRAELSIPTKNLQKLLTAMAVCYFRKCFVWDTWLSSKCVWNLFLLTYLSTIHLLLYLFIHLPFYLLTSAYGSRVYILTYIIYIYISANYALLHWFYKKMSFI